ncbi:MAG TPA: hypothetical protein VEM40_14315 [Nitrospirota bacterium]|nr:hypothetical protein [Nitrospirota bacterium]
MAANFKGMAMNLSPMTGKTQADPLIANGAVWEPSAAHAAKKVRIIPERYLRYHLPSVMPI